MPERLAPAGHARASDTKILPQLAPPPQGFRDAIAEVLAGAAIYVQTGQDYAALADDAGLDYSIRTLVAYVRSATSLLADLKEMKSQQAWRRREAQARGDL